MVALSVAMADRWPARQAASATPRATRLMPELMAAVTALSVLAFMHAILRRMGRRRYLAGFTFELLARPCEVEGRVRHFKVPLCTKPAQRVGHWEYRSRRLSVA